MDETQINKLGSRMRDIYTDVAIPPVPAADAPKHPSRRLRKNRYVTRTATPSGRISTSPPGNRMSRSIGGLVAQRPMTTLLVLAGVGYLLARLSR